MIYVVPASSDKMLNKSLVTKSDVIVFDLEDSVPPSVADKDGARKRLAQFIQVSPQMVPISFQIVISIARESPMTSYLNPSVLRFV